MASPTLRRWPWIAAATLCVMLCGAWFYWGTAQDLYGNNLGDWFGVLTCLFTALAFLGLMAQIHLQRADLEATRGVLDAQHKEMEAQAAAMASQAKSTRNLYEQSEYRVRRDHALRLVDAYLAWLSASREAWQGAVHYITMKTHEATLARQVHELRARASRKTDANKYKPIAAAADAHDQLDRVRSEATSWLQRTQQAVVAVAAAADLISALDSRPDLPDAKVWQEVVSAGSAEDATRAWDAVESAAHLAFARFKRWMPEIPA